MTDIVKRLYARDWIPTNESEHASAMGPMCDSAAAEIERNRESIAELVGAVNVMLERYTELVNCGDCGNWNPETEVQVIQCRAAIAKHTGEK